MSDGLLLTDDPHEACLEISFTPVWAIVGYWYSAGQNAQRVADDYDVPIAYVEAALAYYRQHTAAIDARSGISTYRASQLRFHRTLMEVVSREAGHPSMDDYIVVRAPSVLFQDPILVRLDMFPESCQSFLAPGVRFLASATIGAETRDEFVIDTGSIEILRPLRPSSFPEDQRTILFSEQEIANDLAHGDVQPDIA